MPEVVKLRVADRPKDTTLLEQFDAECKRIREDLEREPNAGFAMVAYARRSETSVWHTGGYYFNDVMDRFWMPAFLAEKVRALIPREVD